MGQAIPRYACYRETVYVSLDGGVDPPTVREWETCRGARPAIFGWRWAARALFSPPLRFQGPPHTARLTVFGRTVRLLVLARALGKSPGVRRFFTTPDHPRLVFFFSLRKKGWMRL